MVTYYPFLTESPISPHRYERDIRILLEARQLYERACLWGRLSRVWGRLIRRERALLDLATIAAACNVHTRHYLGRQTVLIRQICGTEGRSADFDALFYPRHEHNQGRWIGLAAARIIGLSLPPVELIQVGDSYFVRDGHHRISVARALGEQYIEAEVTVWQVREPLPGKQPAVPTLPQLAAIKLDR